MAWQPQLVRRVDAGGDLAVSLGHDLVDAYLEFVAVRCRPNTLLATAYDLKVFFSVVSKEPAAVVIGGHLRVHHCAEGAAARAEGGPARRR
jgi:hypothetical protein